MADKHTKIYSRRLINLLKVKIQYEARVCYDHQLDERMKRNYIRANGIMLACN